MLKLFNNQRKITALLLRACLPAVASSRPANTQFLQEIRRSVSTRFPEERAGVILEGPYYVWSLISDRGDSLMTLHDKKPSDNPEIKCNGDFDDESNLVQINDASLNANTEMISLQLKYNRQRFRLSVERDDHQHGTFNVVMKPVQGSHPVKDSERFIHWEYRGFSMFQSYVHNAGYLGCRKDGSVHVIDVYHMLQPDPRALFLIHANQPPN